MAPNGTNPGLFQIRFQYILAYLFTQRLLSVSLQTDYIIEHGFAGAMVWDLSFDDFSDSFCKLGRYPLLNAIKKRLEGKEVKVGTFQPVVPVRTTPGPESGKTTDKDGKKGMNLIHSNN